MDMLAGRSIRRHTHTRTHPILMVMDVPVVLGARLWLQVCLVNSFSLLFVCQNLHLLITSPFLCYFSAYKSVVSAYKSTSSHATVQKNDGNG